MSRKRTLRPARRRWSGEEDAVLRAMYADRRTSELAERLGRSMSSIYVRAAVLGLTKSRAFIASEASGRLQRADHRGRLTRFTKGHVPWTKGRTGYDAGGRSHETRFKKGQRPRQWRPVGTERITADGYRQRKVSDTGYTPRDYKGVHTLNWEAAFGPVPAGYALVFRDGDRLNCDVANLELVSRQELMRRNSYHTRYPKAIGLAIQLRGALVRKINGLERDREKRN
jgi:hypothetical protein